ncbi:MAG: hypothetical protein ACI85Q_002738 [Salibacteraceae bacterium]|jgi:hypothetical protein
MYRFSTMKTVSKQIYRLTFHTFLETKTLLMVVKNVEHLKSLARNENGDFQDS